MKMQQMSTPQSRGMKSHKKLDAGDLQEYQLRFRALVIAKHQALLVQEAHDTWLTGRLTKLRLKGRYAVDLNTGELVKQNA